MGLRPKTAAKTVEDYSESTNAGAAEEMRYVVSMSIQFL